MAVDVRLLRAGDEAVLDHVDPEVFDDPVDPSAATRFLADPNHRLVVALEGHVVVGFVSGTVYFHPDKVRPEFWINEVSVAPPHRRAGLGRALLEVVLDSARSAGCSEAWVLTERDNHGAMGLYANTGAEPAPTDPVMFTYRLWSQDE